MTVAPDRRRFGIRAPRARWFALAAAYVAALSMALHHLSYGVDLQDEAYYIAFAYRFARGDLPIVDDRSLHQFGSLLMVLSVKAFLAIVGSTRGIVHFARLAYLLVLLVALAFLVVALRHLVGWWWAALLALPLVFYAPMGLSGLSYNSVSALALLLSCAWGMRAGMRGSGPGPALAAGALAGVFAVAYPPLAVAAIGEVLVLGFVLQRRHGARRAFLPAVGLAIVVTPMLAYAGWAGVGPSLDVLRMSEMTGGEGGGLAKLAMVLARPASVVYSWPVPLALALSALGLRRVRPRLAIACVALLPLAALGGVPGHVMWRPMVWQSGYVAYLGSLAFVLYLLVPRTVRTRLVLLTMAVPAIVAGLTVSYASYINIGVSGQGFLAALVATMLLATWFIRGRGPASLLPVRGRRVEPAAWRGWVAVAMVGLLTGGMALLQWQAVFQDHVPAELTARVSGGPWDGLLTTPARRDYVETLVSDLGRLTARNDRVLVYTWCPGAYLAAQGRVASPLMSIGGVTALRLELANRLERDPPEIVVEDRYYWWTQSAFDPLGTYVAEKGYITRVVRPWYTVYEKRGPT